jgi:hypothetical protein
MRKPTEDFTSIEHRCVELARTIEAHVRSGGMNMPNLAFAGNLVLAIQERDPMFQLAKMAKLMGVLVLGSK